MSTNIGNGIIYIIFLCKNANGNSNKKRLNINFSFMSIQTPVLVFVNRCPVPLLCLNIQKMQPVDFMGSGMVLMLLSF